ncbi:hypothetical protein TREMEDRAFT_72210 [Tremella mesenterica DSM 1558]|uniref:uncharacterized protein n=1 Tax=Tremella mesenterica (strain ATCC 24925 / CBS 8224 / DSM 1558 / NBRC 9311 / NRRL Y-6157 / RJB 2259-6 / UBC 559-6) TaxID=578456 RepID=UPI0003F48EC1|nr:uncharacterized protein TREMEDRAFT_72210 [Tremella mesenterica DSM 1558]EIW67299.1 hypothetical protein TREMEDRAFT_72210 [Tremella mesenterica DSM 1558]
MSFSTSNIWRSVPHIPSFHHLPIPSSSRVTLHCLSFRSSSHHPAYRRQTQLRCISGGVRRMQELSATHGIPSPQSEAGFQAMDSKGKGKEETKRRDFKAKKNAITMTPAALTRLRNLLASPSDPKLLRIGVKSRGCAGMAYHLEYVSPPGGRFDEVVEQDGVKVLIDSKALFSIIGSRMDWRDNRLSAGFMFDNPNVVDTCGCGESCE